MGALTIDDISTILMLLFTCVMTVANILLWISTRRTIELQVKSNYSLNHQALVNSHRELFLGLLHQPDVFRNFASANKIDSKQWEVRTVSAFFINQVFAHYLNVANGTIESSYLERLRQDVREVFAFPTVHAHWQHSRNNYAPAFQRFVDELLPSSTSMDASQSDDDSPSNLRPEGLGDPSPLT